MFDIFMPFDNMILESVHIFSYATSYVFTPLMILITILGENISIFGYIGLGLLLFKKTRRMGVILLFTIFTSLVFELSLKELFDRTRPFLENELYNQYWFSAGHIYKDHTSFPSGHMARTVCSIIIIYQFVNKNKIRYVIFSIIFILLMALSRMYLMHHYMTDCIGGFLLGIISAFVGLIIGRQIYKFIYEHRNIRFFDFIINFDIKQLIKK